MEQHIQPPQPMFFRGKTKIIVAAFIAVILGTSTYFWMKNEVAKPDESQNTQTQNQSSSFSDNDSISAEINPRDYSLEEYPIEQSPVWKPFYSQLDQSCYGKWADNNLKDMRLVKNGDVVLPSLRQLIFSSENKRPDCKMMFTKFGVATIPESGKYLYLRLFIHDGEDDEYVMRLDISNSSVKKLSVGKNSDWNNWTGTDYAYKLLFDGKRLIQWNDKGVYFANLETDSEFTLYTAKQNQWLVSSISEIPYEGADNAANYDVRVDEDHIVIGVYEKSEKNKDIKLYNNATLVLDSDAIGESKLIDRITIPIPAN